MRARRVGAVARERRRSLPETSSRTARISKDSEEVPNEVVVLQVSREINCLTECRQSDFLIDFKTYESSSMIIRDLTLRSAASFGSFHLIRLLYDEYMFYLVEHKYDLYVNRFLIPYIILCLRKGCLYPRARPEAPRTREHATLLRHKVHCEFNSSGWLRRLVRLRSP